MHDFIKDSSLRKYIGTVEKTRISKAAFKELTKQITTITQTIIKQSNKRAQESKRNTIFPEDILQTVEEVTGKKPLSWEDLSKEITKLGPIELGKISKSIDTYIDKQKQ